MHHYYHTAQVPFIKTSWVRSMDLSVFTHFQAVAIKRFGSIPLGKGDDDGSTVDAVIKESRFPTEQRLIKWETVRDVLEKYKVRGCGIGVWGHLTSAYSSFPSVIRCAITLLSTVLVNNTELALYRT